MGLAGAVDKLVDRDCAKSICPSPNPPNEWVCGASDRRPPTGDRRPETAGDRREPPVRAKLQNNNPGQDNTKPAGAHYLQKL